MIIQWYPGHMTKARRQMQEDLKLIDLIIELVDARIPLSSRNPDIDEMGRQKSRLVLLNKSDLSEEKANREWLSYFQSKGYAAMLIDSRSKATLKNIQSYIQEACREKLERDRRRGIKNRPIRAMVVGIPNVGKSTFINSYAGKACTKTGNKPGVTKGKQWIRMGKGLELLDTPGILWPKFEDPVIGRKLAWIGSVNEEILNREELALELLAFLKEEHFDLLAERYELEPFEKPETALEQIARKRNCIEKGEQLSYEKAARILLDEFRNGILGRVTMDAVPVEKEE